MNIHMKCSHCNGNIERDFMHSIGGQEHHFCSYMCYIRAIHLVESAEDEPGVAIRSGDENE